MNKVTAVFDVKKDTKNTIRFEEKVTGITDVAKIGTIYVQKSTLKELGFQEGQQLEVTLSVK